MPKSRHRGAPWLPWLASLHQEWNPDCNLSRFVFVLSSQCAQLGTLGTRQCEESVPHAEVQKNDGAETRKVTCFIGDLDYLELVNIFRPFSAEWIKLFCPPANVPSGNFPRRNVPQEERETGGAQTKGPFFPPDHSCSRRFKCDGLRVADGDPVQARIRNQRERIGPGLRGDPGCGQRPSP